jgi:hypothetical protein
MITVTSDLLAMRRTMTDELAAANDVEADSSASNSAIY